MKAILGTMEYGASSVISMIHPPVIKTMKAKTANGILPAGLLVAKDSNGDIVAYDPEGEAPLNVSVGVLTQLLDTTTDDAAVVLVHGTVILEKLLVDTAVPTAEDIASLEAKGIFVIGSLPPSTPEEPPEEPPENP